MCKLLRVGILITIGIPIICIIRGCADDAPTEDVMALSPLEGVAVALSPPPAHTVKVHPDPCIPIFPDTQFALTFDAGVDAATVNETAATGFRTQLDGDAGFRGGNSTIKYRVDKP